MLTVNASPAITSAMSGAFAIGVGRSFTIPTTGHTAATISVIGALPAGVAFTNVGDGIGTIAGIPAPGSGGTYPLTICAANR